MLFRRVIDRELPALLAESRAALAMIELAAIGRRRLRRVDEDEHRGGGVAGAGLSARIGCDLRLRRIAIRVRLQAACIRLRARHREHAAAVANDVAPGTMVLTRPFFLKHELLRRGKGNGEREERGPGGSKHHGT
jgi:hypothetical protein